MAFEIAIGFMTNLLLCGCEPHGHKCLISEGGCGRCFEHCVCPLSGVAETVLRMPRISIGSESLKKGKVWLLK